MARLRARWNQSGRQRSYQDAASVLAMNIWKLACESLLNLENEGFAIQTYQQRLDILLEFAAYSLHIIDRLAYTNIEEDNRHQLLSALAARLIGIFHDNSRDVGDREMDNRHCAEVINECGEAYAQCRFDESDGPGFTLRCLLAERVKKHVADAGEDNSRRWLPDYVLEEEAPAIYRGICRTLDKLLAD